MGENNFIGDEAMFGDEDVYRGWMTLERIKTGDRCFFGNSAVVAAGSVIEDDALIGVKSRLPDSLACRAGETWFGSPAISLPTREKVTLPPIGPTSLSRRCGFGARCSRPCTPLSRPRC